MRGFKARFQKLNPRERALAFLMTGIAFLFCGQLLIGAEIRRFREARSQIGEMDQQLESARANLALATAQRAPASGQSPLLHIRRQNRGLASLVEAMSSVEERRADFKLQKITSEKFESGPDFDKSTLLVEIDAPFNSLGAFLEDLEQSDLLTRVESVEVAREGREMKMCRAKIQLSGFYWRDL